MPQRVVNLFKIIKIEPENRKAMAAAEMGDGMINFFRQLHAIWQLGQGIVARHENDALFRLSAFGDVFMCRHPTSVRHRTVTDLKGTTIAQLHDGI